MRCAKLNFDMKALCITAFLAHVIVAAVPSPPLIVVQPEKLVIFSPNSAVQLPCIANGNPLPRYFWTYNDLPFDPAGQDDRLRQLPGVGTIVIANPRSSDQGYYKCRAANEFGIAVANTVQLLNASLDRFYKPSQFVVTTTVGAPLTLLCEQPSSFPKPLIYWQKFERSLSSYASINYNARVTQDLDGKLHISNAVQSDEGNYICNVHNSVLRSTVTGSVTRVIIEGGSFARQWPVKRLYSSPTNLVVYRGEVLKLKCIFGGMPTPFVQWFRGDGSSVNASNIASYGQEVVVVSASYGDAGSYECRGYNPASTNPETATMFVTVHAKPYFLHKPTAQTRGVGESVTFICQGDGVPKPVTKWYINGNLTVSSGHKIILEGSSMTITNLTLEDKMALQCNITDEYSGWELVSFSINVLNEPPVIPSPPPLLFKVADGSSFSATCSAFGAPRPMIRWKKNNQVINGGRFFIHENGTIVLQAAIAMDSGTYTCEAYNSNGATSATVMLVVRQRTMIREAPRDTVVFAGQDTKFTCTATTDGDEMQNLVVLWQKDGQDIDYSATKRLYQSVQDNALIISSPNALDTGTYTCVASNGIDFASASGTLRVKDSPGPPISVSILECHQTKAKISWKPGPNNNSPILNFILQYNTTFDPSTWYDVNTSISSKDNVYLVQLKPYVTYTFRVLSRNIVGTSLPTASSYKNTCATQSGVPTSNPAVVRTLNEDPSQLVISWQSTPAIDQNGPGFKYKVTYKMWDPVRRQFNCGNSCLRDLAPSGSDKSSEAMVIIKGVQTYTPYLIYVATTNIHGDSIGTITKIVGFSGESSPEISVNDFRIDLDKPQTATTASFVWTQVDVNAPAMRGFFRGYQIRYWLPSSEDHTATKTVLYVVLRDSALEGKEYYKYVQRETGNDTNSISSRSFLPVNQNMHMGSQIDQLAMPKERQGFRYLLSIDGSVVRCTLFNLPPNSVISFDIAVINKKFSGPCSEDIRMQTSIGRPGMVMNIDIVGKGPTHVSIRWQPPLDPNGSIEGYRLGYTTLNHLAIGPMQYPDQKDCDQFATSAKISGLFHSQRYRFYVWAKTSAGYGEENYIDEWTNNPFYPGAPSATAIVIANCTNCVNVSWVPATIGVLAGAFYVQYRQQSAVDNWQSTIQETHKSWIVLVNLKLGKIYEIRVVASNGDGYEATSASIFIHSSETETEFRANSMHVFGATWFASTLCGAILLAILITLVIFIQGNIGGTRFASNGATNHRSISATYDGAAYPARNTLSYGGVNSSGATVHSHVFQQRPIFDERNTNNACDNIRWFAGDSIELEQTNKEPEWDGLHTLV